ncbi:outer membrane beta-barrel protein [Abyssalbus ytuae]|uniref:Porin family protein n=1 Tax=Abyssalbus ytuae TaxID=2926907 RepID=A0A9E7CUG3_9FLAO|nr:outer membrane beta-barrel protein [Abyssalbus ytuae]UOB18372.1 porin family protein [Abyssalbus ytuae]
MKQNFLLLVFLLTTLLTYSQEKKFSIDANYPIPVGDNFLGDNFKGAIDLGLKYRFFETTNFFLGASMNAGILTKGSEDVNPANPVIGPDTSVTAYVFQPRLFLELNQESMSKLHPSLGLGYSFLHFKANAFDFTDDVNGVNVHISLAYDISEKVYIQAQYDFIKAKATGDVKDVKYNTHINILKFGLGVRL